MIYRFPKNYEWSVAFQNRFIADGPHILTKWNGDNYEF